VAGLPAQIEQADVLAAHGADIVVNDLAKLQEQS
jgi:hypothetical protein